MSNITEKERQEIEKFASENAVYAKDDFEPYGLYGDALFEFETDSIAKGAEFLAELRNAEKPSEDLVQQIEDAIDVVRDKGFNDYEIIKHELVSEISKIKLINPNAELLDMLIKLKSICESNIDEFNIPYLNALIEKHEKP